MRFSSAGIPVLSVSVADGERSRAAVPLMEGGRLLLNLPSYTKSVRIAHLRVEQAHTHSVVFSASASVWIRFSPRGRSGISVLVDGGTGGVSSGRTAPS